jgi:hypothetical protein
MFYRLCVLRARVFSLCVRLCLLLCLFLYALAFLYKILCLRTVNWGCASNGHQTEPSQDNRPEFRSHGVWHCQRPSHSPYSPTTTAHIIRSWHWVRPVADRYWHGRCPAYCECVCSPVPTYHGFVEAVLSYSHRVTVVVIGAIHAPCPSQCTHGINMWINKSVVNCQVQ